MLHFAATKCSAFDKPCFRDGCDEELISEARRRFHVFVFYLLVLFGMSLSLSDCILSFVLFYFIPRCFFSRFFFFFLFLLRQWLVLPFRKDNSHPSAFNDSSCDTSTFTTEAFLTDYLIHLSVDIPFFFS